MLERCRGGRASIPPPHLSLPQFAVAATGSPRLPRRRRCSQLPEDERPMWATALYGGLRRGELMALAWEHVDFGGGVIRVERSYDPRAAEYVTPKSRAGTRKVPIASVLREHLVAHRLRSVRPTALVFGRTPTRPFDSLADQAPG